MHENRRNITYKVITGCALLHIGYVTLRGKNFLKKHGKSLLKKLQKLCYSFVLFSSGIYLTNINEFPSFSDEKILYKSLEHGITCKRYISIIIYMYLQCHALNCRAIYTA